MNLAIIQNNRRLLALLLLVVAIITWTIIRKSSTDLISSATTGRLLVQGMSTAGRLFINDQLTIGNELELPIGEYRLVVEEPDRLPAEFDVVITSTVTTTVTADQPSGGVDGVIEGTVVRDADFTGDQQNRFITVVDQDAIRLIPLEIVPPSTSALTPVAPQIPLIPLAGETTNRPQSDLKGFGVTYPTQSCIADAYQGDGLTIRWSSTDITPTFVDVSPDKNFEIRYHKPVTETDASAGYLAAPKGFVGFDGTDGELSIMPDTVYYVRLWDGTIHSQTATVLVPACPGSQVLGISTSTYDRNPSHYQAAFVGKSNNPTLKIGESTSFEFNLKNTGLATWQKGVVRLGSDRPTDRVSILDPGAGWERCNRVELVQETVAPGEVGTFRFVIAATALTPPGTYREHFRQVVDGVTWFDDLGLSFDVTIITNPALTSATLPTYDREATHYQAELVSQSGDSSLAHGETGTLEAKFKNTGTATWQRGVVRLGSDIPADRVSIFDPGTGWDRCNRVQLVESSVAPGGTGTFRFEVTATTLTPAGTYREYFRPVVDGVAWFGSSAIGWEVTVTVPAPEPTQTQTSTPTATNTETTPAVIPPPPTPSVSYIENSCVDSPYTGAGVSISWLTPSRPVTWIDISPDADFTRRYHKQALLTYPALVVETAPNGFVGFDGTEGELTLSPDTVYYVRTWDGANHSQVATFLLPGCPVTPGPSPEQPTPLPPEPQPVPVPEPYDPPLFVPSVTIPLSTIGGNILSDYTWAADQKYLLLSSLSVSTDTTSITDSREVGIYDVAEGVYRKLSDAVYVAVATDTDRLFVLARRGSDMELQERTAAGNLLSVLPISVPATARGLNVNSTGTQLFWYSQGVESNTLTATLAFNQNGWLTSSSDVTGILPGRVDFSPAGPAVAFRTITDTTAPIAVLKPDNLMNTTNLVPITNHWQWTADGVGFWSLAKTGEDLRIGVAKYAMQKTDLGGAVTKSIEFSVASFAESFGMKIDEAQTTAMFVFGDAILNVGLEG